MPAHDIIAAYDATEEAADGLALAQLLCERLGRELVVARVIADGRTEVTDRHEQRAIRETIAETRRALVAALPEAASAELTPVVDGSMARGLHALAAAEDAEALVVGSSHHHGLGRLLLGGGPELVADGAPCPVFVAPPGFRSHAVLDPEVVAIAFDGTPAAETALRYGAELAVRLGTAMRIVTVQPPWYERPAGAPHDLLAVQAAGRTLAERLAKGQVRVDVVERRGDPADQLAAETRGEAGLLVVGSRRHGALRRVLLGSVSAAVLRAAAGPVVVATA
ncbi:MAG: universal stress protein [Solirubrobacterales bacterium]|nr:universal stress protein [Solirubrobacterales bacterium]